MTTVYLLIDPPVSPLSPESAIRAWIGELLRMQTDPRNATPAARAQIAAAVRQARSWLRMRSAPPLPVRRAG